MVVARPRYLHFMGGAFGVPFGVWVMANLPPAELTFTTGIVLLIYAIWMISKPRSILVK